MISNCISDDVPPQMTILNMVILVIMHLCSCLILKYLFPHNSEHCKPHKVACHQAKCDVINGIKLFPTLYCRYTVANL